MLISTPISPSSTIVVNRSVARLNSAPASIAALTRLRAGSVSASQAARARSSLRPGVLMPSSVWWKARLVIWSMSAFFCGSVFSGGA